jgi:ABC-type nitrate/sulfonate/bicarbonate transport system substrate-binding protein
MASGDLTDLDLSWDDQHGGTGEMVAKFAADELDVASILTEGTVKAVADGLPVTVIQVYVESPLQWGVFVPARSALTDERELDGARIAISRYGSGSHLMAYIQAERMGWSIDDDQFVVVSNLDGAIDAFAKDQADLFLWDQFMTRSLVAAGQFRQVAVQKTPWPSFVIAARNEVVTGRTTELGRLVDSVVGQTRRDGPELVAQRYGLTVDTAEEWFAATVFAPRQALDPTMAETVLDTLTRAGLR